MFAEKHCLLLVVRGLLVMLFLDVSLTLISKKYAFFLEMRKSRTI